MRLKRPNECGGSAPALLVAGRYDRLDAAVRINCARERIPNCRNLALADGNWPMLERPVMFQRAFGRFLTG